MGKLPKEKLQELLECVKSHPEVIIPPRSGYDSGVQLLNEDEYLVVSTDPCIGVPEKWLGWLLVHYAASDVALFGATPRFCTITLLGPADTKANAFLEIMKQVCSAAEDLNMAVVTGHTGTYGGLSSVVGVCTAYGTVRKEKLITPGDARAGDVILCTKQIGQELAVNFALTHRALAENLFDVIRTQKLQNLVGRQTCVAEAQLLANVVNAHAMHDTTEGGLVAALNDLADASNLGFIVDWEKIPFSEEIRILQTHFSLSQTELLSTSSTGTVLAAVNPQRGDLALKELRKHAIEACLIGTFTKGRKRLLHRGKKKAAFPPVAEDPYARIMLK